MEDDVADLGDVGVAVETVLRSSLLFVRLFLFLFKKKQKISNLGLKLTLFYMN